MFLHDFIEFMTSCIKLQTYLKTPKRCGVRFVSGVRGGQKFALSIEYNSAIMLFAVNVFICPI